MLAEPILRAPFFEIGPKSYLAGDEVVDLAVAADEASQRHGIQVLFTAPLLELERVCRATRHIIVSAPHMDPIPRGRGLTKVLPESVVAAGARAIMLNHAEHPLDAETIAATIARAGELGLATVVCAGSLAEIREMAALEPDVIVAEPAELIGTGTTSDLAYMETSSAAVRAVNPRILVLQAAGISSGDDVRRVIAAGADATGSSSGIAKAADRAEMVDQMLAGARAGWDKRHTSE